MLILKSLHITKVKIFVLIFRELQFDIKKINKYIKKKKNNLKIARGEWGGDSEEKGL